MNKPTCPFYVVEEFLSPLLCEEIIDAVDYTVPNRDKNEHEVLTVKRSSEAEMLVFERLNQVLPEIQAHYKLVYKGTEPLSFEWYPQGSNGPMGAENSEFIKNKWLRVRPCDLTGIVFLSDYQESPSFDAEYEVYGGKLEFPQHQFGFNPTRGTLVVFPSDPHFINQTSTINIGDLYQVRIQMVATKPYIYDPAKFPGNYITWFN